MESLRTDIVWMCNICTQPQKDIFILPCQHKFCERCLNIWVGVYTDTYRPGHQQFPCRICWQINYLPKEGLNAYHRNYDMCQLERTLENLNVVQQNELTPQNNHQSTTTISNNPFELISHYQQNNPSTVNLFAIQSDNRLNSDHDMNGQQQHFQPNDYSNNGANHTLTPDSAVINQLSSSAPGSLQQQNGMDSSNGNDMDTAANDVDNNLSAEDVICHLEERSDCYIPYHMTDCDRMRHQRICFPNSCHMYHTDIY